MGFETGEANVAFGDRRGSIVVVEAGVVSVCLLDLVLSLGTGEPLRSDSGDFGGTAGGKSNGVRMAGSVSTFSKGFWAPGLRIGDSGFPNGPPEASSLGTSAGLTVVDVAECMKEGPVTAEIRASPNGPARQLVPGALLDRSCPNASAEAFRRGGRPGIVAGPD